MPRPIEAILWETPDALTCDDIRTMLEVISEDDPNVALMPTVVNADQSYAFGFVKEHAADVKADFDLTETSKFAEGVRRVLNDMNLENPDGVYDFAGIITKIMR